jgi:tetratricopeptide (TPR) repeat protein
MKRDRVLLVAAALGVLLPARARAKERWVEVTTPHFVVVSNSDEGQAREVARNFEEIRLVFQLALPRARTADARLPILAVKDEKSLKRLLPEFWEDKDRMKPSGILRFSGYKPEIALIVGKAGAEAEAYSVVYHEYFHYLADLNTPGLPSWLNEGLASYWENTTIQHDKVVVAAPSARQLHTLQEGTPLPLEELLTASPLTLDRKRVPMFYAQSWALTHYLMIGDRAIRQQSVTKYVKLVTEGADAVEAATTAFGALDALESALRAYSRRFLFNVLEMPVSLDIDEAAFETRELPEADALALQGRFVAAGGLPEKAKSLLHEALERDSGNPVAAEGMGVLELRRGHRDESAQWLRLSVASPKASPVAHLLFAATLVDAASKEQHLLQAISLDRDFAPAFVELAYLYGAADIGLERALAMANEASAREPGNATNRLLVARVLRRMGRNTEARDNVAVAVRVAIWNAHGTATNDVCRFGSLSGFAAEVMSACEHAVRQRPDYAGFRDSRGLARALTGDFEGAIDDFQSFVETEDGSPEVVAQHREWIRLLEEGANPFDEKTLAKLRNRPF